MTKSEFTRIALDEFATRVAATSGAAFGTICGVGLALGLFHLIGIDMAWLYSGSPALLAVFFAALFGARSGTK